MHGKIKNFTLSGEIGEKNLVQTRERLIKGLTVQMRDTGYVPVLDMDPQFSISYDDILNKFSFKLTIYGSWVGAHRECQYEGVSNGKLLRKSTAKPR